MKDICTTIKNLFLYCGLSKPMFKVVRPKIGQENDRYMQGLSLVTLVFGVMMTILSGFGALSRIVLPAYLFLLISSLFFICVRMWCKKKQKEGGLVLAYLQIFCLLIYGILNSAVYAPIRDSAGVTFCVLILMPCFVLLDRPARECPMLLGACACYISACYRFKSAGIFKLEVVNSVSFTVIGCLGTLIFTSRLVRNLSNQFYIEQERDIDDLTKVQTRRAADSMIQMLIDHGTQGAFLMLDVDNFKKTNDTFGHLYGDAVLRRLAGAVSANVQRNDIVGRFGGDEFIIYLPNCPEEKARRVSDSILKAVHTEFKDDPLHITCSIGVTFSHPGESIDSIFDRADKATYEAKRLGKGRVIFFPREED